MFKGIVSLLLIVGATVIFFTQTKKYFPEIKATRGQISVYNKTIETIRGVKDSVDKLLGEYNSISQENINKVNKMIPSGSDQMKLVVQIENMMKSRGLSLKSIDTKESDKKISFKTKTDAEEDKEDVTGEKKEEKMISLLSLSIKAQGSYSAFHSFLIEAERSLRLLDIDSVKINTVANKEIYDFSIEAHSYYRDKVD